MAADRHPTNSDSDRAMSVFGSPAVRRAMLAPALITLGVFALLITWTLGVHGQEARPPAVPDTPTGDALWSGIVELTWNEVPGADSYDVQYFHVRDWLELPGQGIEVAFYRPNGAVIRGVSASSPNYIRVRAVNPHGASEWSEYVFIRQTGSPGAWEGVPEPVNTPVTGAPVVSGDGEVGGTLTADVSGISDENGLDDVQFRYQWVSSDGTTDTDMARATGSSHTLVAADDGRSVRVRVSFTDRHGFRESVVSSPLHVGTSTTEQPDFSDTTTPELGDSNDASTSGLTISGTFEVGETLTVDMSAVIVTNLRENATSSYQWMRSDEGEDTDIENATSSTYVLKSHDQGKAIKVRVETVDVNDLKVRLVSAATPEIAWAGGPPNSQPAGSLDIAGVTGYPTTFVADTDGISDDDGLRGAVFEYQWLGLLDGSESEITGATGPRYEADLADGYDGYGLRLAYVDDGGTRETLTDTVSDIRQHVVDHATRLPDLLSKAPYSPLLERAEPDFVVLLPADASTETVRNTEPTLVLRFWSAIQNVGDGAFHVSGNPQLSDAADDTSHTSWQRTRNADGNWVKLTQPPIRYEVADYHHHFHLMGLAEYSLWDAAGETRITTAPKVGFCLRDTHLIDEDLYPDISKVFKVYFLNCQHKRPAATWLDMGISVGFQDIYRRGMSFQYVDVSDVRPGLYRLAGQTDPNDMVWESDETNNDLALSDDVQVIPGYIALDQQVSTEQDTAIELTLAADLFGEPGPLRFRVVEAPANGELDVDSMTALDTSTVTYTPDDGFEGRDTFAFEAFDADSEFPRTPVRATVTVLVGEVAEDQLSASSDATLASLSLSDLDIGEFGARTLAYSANATSALAETAVSAVARHSGATVVIRLNGAVDSDGVVPLSIGGNIITVEVTAEDGRTTRAYTVAVNKRAPNSPATGVPTISGTTRVGTGLQASKADISDADGLTSVEFFDYQWIRSDGTTDTDIPGADTFLYTLQMADLGKMIKVRASFTDDEGNAESITSEPVGPVSLYKLNARESDGEVVLRWHRPRGLSYPNNYIMYQILRHRPELGETRPLVYVRYTQSERTGYTDANVEPGVLYVYQIRASNAFGVLGPPSMSVSIRMSTTTSDLAPELPDLDDRTWDAGEPVSTTLPEATGGDPPLTYSLSGLPAGLSFDPASRSVSGTSTAEAGTATYGVSDADGDTSTATFGWTVHEAANAAATGAPVISGTASVGETLTADTAAVADADGMSSSTYAYQWVRSDGSTDTDIAGATGSSYTLTDSDLGKRIKVRVSFIDDADSAESLTSAPTATVTAPLTASIHDAPGTHNGVSAFTFELRFSDEPRSDFSYRTLRDHAFAVTGGTVVKSRRLARPLNMRWEIAVEPDGQHDVTVVLPATIDCAASGAICTDDGRKLSGKLELTVRWRWEHPG